MLTESIIECEERVENLAGEITVRDSQISQLRREVSERDGLIRQQTQLIMVHKEQIDNLTTLGLEHERQLSLRSIEIERIYNSISWQITRPLRYSRKIFQPFSFIRRSISLGLRRAWLRVPLSPVQKENIKTKLFLTGPRLFSWSKTYKNWQNIYPSAKFNGNGSCESEPFGVSTKSGCKILLVAHEFSLTGAPRAVLYLGNAILENFQIRPEIIAPVDGGIRDEFEKKGFSTIVAPWLMHELPIESEYSKLISSFDIIIVTSISAYYIVRHIERYANKLIWWVHEDASGFDYIRSSYAPDLTRLLERCDAVWLGSPVCSLPVIEIVSSDRVYPLVYGCDDVALPRPVPESDRMVFTIVGSVEPRKGQDIFLSAIERLPEFLRSKAKFRIIGSASNEWAGGFYQEVLARASLIAEVECLPNMPFEELQNYYAESDVIVSASRADPMPIAITQGLMFSKPCLFSSAIGHASLLEHEKNCIIFENESIQDLSEKIEWFLNNPQALLPLGDASRIVYEKVFLMNVFCKNLERIISFKNV